MIKTENLVVGVGNEVFYFYRRIFLNQLIGFGVGEN